LGIRFAPFAIGVAVAMLVAGLLGFGATAAVRSRDSSEPAITALPPGTDPDAAVLRELGVQRSDVGPNHAVTLIQNGDGLDAPTLDLCNGTYPSEMLRTARIQVAQVDTAGGFVLSTEAVLYRNPAATRQAFSELEDVTESCPGRPVPSPTGGATVETVFGDPPDTTWADPPGDVRRVAYAFQSFDLRGNAYDSVAVYLRRGRVLLGIYFTDVVDPQAAVAGATTMEGIVNVLAARVAALPESVVNG
jgi:hypothetical protein